MKFTKCHEACYQLEIYIEIYIVFNSDKVEFNATDKQMYMI